MKRRSDSGGLPAAVDQSGSPAGACRGPELQWRGHAGRRSAAAGAFILGQRPIPPFWKGRTNANLYFAFEPSWARWPAGTRLPLGRCTHAAKRATCRRDSRPPGPARRPRTSSPARRPCGHVQHCEVYRACCRWPGGRATPSHAAESGGLPVMVRPPRVFIPRCEVQRACW